MKKFLVSIAIIISTVITASSVLAETEGSEESAPALTVARLVIAGAVEDREPVGIVNAFAASTEKVYCFLEAKDIPEDTTVSFVWYHGEQEMARVDLPVNKGQKWRTYSSKKLAGLKGEWKVELQDAEGTVLETAAFTVE